MARERSSPERGAAGDGWAGNQVTQGSWDEMAAMEVAYLLRGRETICFVKLLACVLFHFELETEEPACGYMGGGGHKQGCLGALPCYRCQKLAPSQRG